jgi:hypothetical protein
VPPRRRTDPAEGRQALEVCRAAGFETSGIPRAVVATAVRYALEELAVRHPGRSVEVRVPPFGAVQCIEGPMHKRGTPPNVLETDAATWLALATGALAWGQALDTGAVRASGQRADLSQQLPVVGL